MKCISLMLTMLILVITSCVRLGDDDLCFPSSIKISGSTSFSMITYEWSEKFVYMTSYMAANNESFSVLTEYELDSKNRIIKLFTNPILAEFSYDGDQVTETYTEFDTGNTNSYTRTVIFDDKGRLISISHSGLVDATIATTFEWIDNNTVIQSYPNISRTTTRTIDWNGNECDQYSTFIILGF